jgi:hypothetical protein
MKYAVIILFAMWDSYAGDNDSTFTRARLLYNPSQNLKHEEYNTTYVDANNAFHTHLELLKLSEVQRRVLKKLNNKISLYDFATKLVVKQVTIGMEKTFIIELSYPKCAFSVEIINALCTEYLNWRKEWDLKSTNDLLLKFESHLLKNKITTDSLEKICINKFGKLSSDCQDRNSPEQDTLLRQLSTSQSIEDLLRKRYEEVLLSKDTYFPDLIIIEPAQ